jgi:inosose dehydratase
VIAVANAPCSWGVLEFESKAESPGYTQVLDEIRESGYAGTELGDWGFMPTDPAALGDELARRQLTMLGAFVTTRLIDPASFDESARTAVKTARLLSAVATTAAPVIVLSDEPTADPVRARMAGRIAAGSGLDDRQWPAAARGVEQIARAVLDQTGLRTVVHHHCATYVETPAEIDRLLSLTDPALVGLCLDSGHATYGGGDPRHILASHRPRVWHVHFKDCEPAVAAQARAAGWDYQTALRHGLFCELGRGTVDFAGLLADLRAAAFNGWVVVEQDVLPAMGAPLASATRNREYLRSIGL